MGPLRSCACAEQARVDDAVPSAPSLRPRLLSRRRLDGNDRNRVPRFQRTLQGPATTVMKAVNRALGFLQRSGDLAGAEADHVTQHQHLALVLRQLLQSFADVEASLEARIGFRGLGDPNL